MRHLSVQGLPKSWGGSEALSFLEAQGWKDTKVLSWHKGLWNVQAKPPNEQHAQTA